MIKILTEPNPDKLEKEILIEAKEEMVLTLNEFLKSDFKIVNYEDDCHRTEIETQNNKGFELNWKGFIGSTNYRDDGKLEFGAFLFPFIGEKRIKAYCENDYDYAFRYLWLKQDGKWYDLGWQIDEHYEFEHWYIKEKS